MKLRYDKAHKSLIIRINDRVFLRLHHEYEILDVENKKLIIQRAGSFKMTEVLNNELTYRLELSLVMKIHFVINISQLESAFNIDDFFHKINNDESSFVVKYEKELEYEIERLLRHRTSRGKKQYLVK